jgi:asparagine synthase (glutamine-hydrolysing)
MPQELFDRPKHGFTPPVDSWLRGPLREWAGDLLNHDRLQREGYFNAGAINDCWKAHQSGERDYGQGLWTAAMFQAWRDEWAIAG